MNEEQQWNFLTGLGSRLDNWTSPGDSEDYLYEDVALWDDVAKEYLRPPLRVIDVLLCRLIRIKDFSTQKPVLFIVNPAQARFSRERTGRDVIAKAGRAGFTTYLSCCSLLRTITNPGHTSVLVSHRGESSIRYFQQVQFSFRSLPEPLGTLLRSGVLRTDIAGGRRNVREIYLPVLNSKFTVETAGEFSPGEGDSIQDLLCDEVARWKKGDPKQVLATLTSHVTGDDTRVILFSRPFGDTGLFHEEYQKAKNGSSDFHAHFFQWWWNPGQRKKGRGHSYTPNPEDLKLIARYQRWRDSAEAFELPETLSLDQLYWRWEKKRELLDLFGQEFAEDDVSCFIGSSSCPFDAIALDKVLHDSTPQLERTKDGATLAERDNGVVIWRRPEEGHRYLLFADVASTLHVSRDAFQVIDLDSGEQCAEFRGRMEPVAYGKLLDSVGRRFNDALLAVETNLGKISATVLKVLSDCEYPHLYYYIAAGEQVELGWSTNPKNRPSMLETFSGILSNETQKLHSDRLVEECKNCVRKENRIEPKKGMADDLVMAAAGAYEIRRLGNWERRPWAEAVEVATEEHDDERGWVTM